MNVYEIITDKIITQLEQGTVPWRQPWNAGHHAPRSFDGRRYTGINVFLLIISRLEQGFDSPYWLTYKRAQQLGGHVRKGEQSTVIIFWKRIEVTEVDQATGEPARKIVPMLRYYRVFNLDQCEGIEAPAPSDAADNDHVDNVTAEEITERYLANGGPTVSEDGTEAYYRPSADHVTLPPRRTFDTPELFYCTRFHELTHSTNHPSRLDRKYPNQSGFGSHGYGREELVAEMGAAFLAAEASISETLPSHAAYCRAWIRTIKEDSRAVVVAAGAAQKAADLILGRTVEHEQHEPALVAA